MKRLIVTAILAIAVFTMLPGFVSDWLVTNGYLENTEAKGQAKAPGSGLGSRSGKTGNTNYKGRSQTVLHPNAAGHYLTPAYLNNKKVRVLIDTGASFLALTYEDARRIGLRPRSSDFKHAMRTANGIVAYASATVRAVRIGQVTVRNVKAVIAPKGALGTTLMGMSFLRKLKVFKVERGKLVLGN